jgi:hypothetical protein
VTIAELSIPNDWQEIMPAWMTGAIRRHYPDAVVSDVAVVLRDEGTNRRARLELTYSAGGPATVFVEAADPAHVELVALTSRLLHEPRLFTSGVVLPLDHPTVYTAIIDEEGPDHSRLDDNPAVIHRTLPATHWPAASFWPRASVWWKALQPTVIR